MNTIQPFLEHKAYNLRKWSIIQTTHAGSGHPTSCLSAADIVAALFFYGMHYDPMECNNLNNDSFILSKGHAAPILYAAWKEAGVLTEQDLLTYRQVDSVLEGHPTRRFACTQAATGSLGIGLSIGVGQVLAARLDQRDNKVFVLMGDSETSEGSVWEAVQIAAHYRLNNLIGIIDANRLGQSTSTLFGHHINHYTQVLTGFGWHTIAIDGHDMRQIMESFDQARAIKDKPVMIIAKTVKGYGVDIAENKEGFHGKPFEQKNLDTILSQLKVRFATAAAYVPTTQFITPFQQSHGQVHNPDITQFQQSHTHTHNIGQQSQPYLNNASQPSQSYAHSSQQKIAPNTQSSKLTMPEPTYAKQDMIATRYAYGQALAILGDQTQNVVSLDAEVKNSTFAQLFEDKHPTRFFQCFIAEQNMVGMAIGLERCGKIPFSSTFGAFFSRAFDQVRMGAIGQAALRLVGSHCGVSIGQDGPSQMALEDIALMCALPESTVLYPSDAVSTYKLVEQMANYSQGISYLRTTRGQTPIIYNNNETFPIGGCKIVRHSLKDAVCIIAAGVTLFEALKAYDILITQTNPIHVSVIDLYSIKPFDRDTVIKVASASHNAIITVEDHYIQGGIGQIVAAALCNTPIVVKSLAVTKLPRSGKAEELMHMAGIDAHAIVTAVHNLIKEL